MNDVRDMSDVSEESQEGKKAATWRYHALRILIFATACICGAIGMILLSLNSQKQAKTETVVSETITQAPVREVLFLMSYSDDHVSVPYERAGFLDVMKRSSVGVKVEYMDAKNNPAGTEAYRRWEATMQAKLAAHGPYDAIVCADDDALHYVDDHREELFPTTPVVFLGINDYAYGRQVHEAGWATGLFETEYLEKTMQVAATLEPEADTFLAVVDDTPTGQGYVDTWTQAQAHFGDYRFEILNASQLTRDELAEALGKVDEDTVVFELSCSQDSAGNVYTVDDSSRFISEACPVPVYKSNVGGVGEGIVGSGFVDFEAQGERAGDLTVRLLNGEKPADIDVVDEGLGTMAFDAKVMKKFGLDTSLLPEGAVLINDDTITWQTIRPMIFPIFLIVVGVVLVVIFAYIGYRRSLKDSQEIVASRDRLRKRFYHDQLTELPNRQMLASILASPARGDKIQSMVDIDLDDFNDINDTYGHAVGDQVVIEIAGRLAEAKDVLHLVRSAGDEFLLSYDHPLAAEGPELRALREILDRPVEAGGSDLDISASMGVANREPDMDSDDMVLAADLAVRAAKKVPGKHSVSFYDPSMHFEMEQKLEITTYLKQAIHDESFQVLYQPQVDVETLDVTGYEALVRLKSNAYYPSQFIPVAEMSGMIADIDRIVTKKVVRQLATWRKRRKRLRTVSINFSAEQLKDEGYLDFLEQLLRENEVPADLIKIEITESLLLDNEKAALGLFERLHRMGIAMALDDFGTGYTALARVASIPAAYVKLDKSLVDTYMVPGKEGFIRDVVTLVHGLGKKVTVEGVETRQQYEICKRLHCDEIQGYYFSKPVRAEEAVGMKPELW